MLIAQITDTHLTPRGCLLGGRLDAAARLARIVDRILALDTRPDAVLLSGDLADAGHPEAYAILRETIARLDVPAYAVPGNHDDREALREAFADAPWMPQAPGSRLCYTVDVGALRVIALDSLDPGRNDGYLGDAQRSWLAEALAAARDRRVLLMVHHPPVNSGVAVMDAMRLRDAEDFGRLVAARPNIERIVCGHLHRSMHVRWRGTCVAVCSAAVEQIHLGLRPDAPLGTIAEPAGFSLHYDDPADGLVTHAVPVGDFDGPWIYD